MIVGVVGGGQLARMLALAGYPLGLRCLILDPAPDACAGQVAALLTGAYDDRERLAELAARAEVVTFDFENVPESAARFLAERVPVYPPPAALGLAQDRLVEKTLFRRLGIPTPRFAAVDSLDALTLAVADIGLPAMLKTRRLGYDGKGQQLLRRCEDLQPAWQALGGAPLILEAFVPFQREVSILSLRARDGLIVHYPLVENRHGNGILRRSDAPFYASDLAVRLRGYAEALLVELNYVGLLTLEFFVVDGQPVINEMAPRVHNSGHWTIEGAETSQFENHLRAVAGLPLGSTSARGCSTMLNFIGALPDRDAFLAVSGAHWHDYGKDPKPGRKVGHATLRAEDREVLERRLEALPPLVEP